VCVCEFTNQLGLAKPTVSYHSSSWAHAGLIRREKRGTFAYSVVEPEAMERLHRLVEPQAPARTA
jgi:ArsR family transcriptional regulator